MLTADLVRVRCTKEGEIHLTKLAKKTRERALAIAEHYIDAATHGVGDAREAFNQAAGAIKLSPRESKLAAGLLKLVTDRCDFSMGADVDPPTLRLEVFALAAARRAALSEGDHFDRQAVLAEAGEKHGLEAGLLEHLLFADLKQAHVLTQFDPITPERLLEEYELQQAQAVLLKAVKVTVWVRCADAGAYRTLFNRLKWLRLMYSIHPDGESGRKGPKGYRIEIDGPFSMFSASTKYGLQLALSLTALRMCAVWRLKADVRWGKYKKAMTFELSGEGPGSAAPLRLADEVQTLMERLNKQKGSDWHAAPAAELLHLPGVGICAPDLVVTHPSGRKVFVEVMGFWSRDAVWRRVELVEAGLPEPIIFCVSARLRVSEAALDEGLPGSLYVYKGVVNAKAVLERLNAYLT
ncbi:MAG: DUF790 family protein [Bradymonadia bacterium]